MWVDSAFFNPCSSCVATLAVDPSLPFLRAAPRSEVPGFGTCRPADAPTKKPQCRIVPAGGVSSCASQEDDDKNTSRAPWFHSVCVRGASPSQCAARKTQILRCRASRMNCVVPGGTRPSAPGPKPCGRPCMGHKPQSDTLGMHVEGWSPGGACTIGGRSLGSKLGQYQLAIGPRPPERRTNHGCNPVVCPIPGREGHSSGGGIGCLACKLPACPEQLRGCPTGR